MNEYEAIKALLERHEDKTAFYWSIIILLGLNLVAALANFFQAIYLKNKEDKSYRLKIREDRRITIYESLYKLIEELTYFDGRINNDDLLNKIAGIDRYISQNGIYISKQMRTAIINCLDYYRSITIDFRKKNISSETYYLNEIESLFNK